VTAAAAVRIDPAALCSWLCLDTRTKHRILKAAGFPDPLDVIDRRLHQLTDAERACIAGEVRRNDYGPASWGLGNL